jgi:hypothetical protein
MNIIRRTGWICLLAWYLAGSGLLPAAERPPTFAEWLEDCAELPGNRTLAGRLPPRESLPLQSFAELDRVLNAFFGVVTNGPLAGKTHWVGDAALPGTFLNVQRAWFLDPPIPFQPFAQKLVLPPAAKVFLQGDLHGDLHSLLAVLRRLNDRQLLDGFAIKDPDLHVIFLGDYTDRGVYGVEVLYTLLRLKLANPDRVHFARGNHEDLSLIARYGFLAEGRAKFGAAFNAAKILRAYDFLPVVIYLGVGDDFVQLCHGGMEPGYAPATLLAAPGTNRFEFIGKLRQAEFAAKNPGWLESDPTSLAAVKEFYRDFTPTEPTMPEVLGFMWNDFTVFSDEPAFAHNPDRAFVYGRPAVQHILSKAGGGKAKVHAVIRGHQHSGIPNPLMRRLVASQGLFRHWQETNSPSAQTAASSALSSQLETTPARPIPEGSVWTFNVAPNSVYGAGCNFDFVTFGLLKLGAKFGDWRMEVESFTPAAK